MIEFGLGRYELAQMFTPLGLLVLDCKTAVNPNLTEEQRQQAALMARTGLTGLALQEVFGRTLNHPGVEARKRKILETLRKVEDPAIVTAINTVFPSEPAPVAAK